MEREQIIKAMECCYDNNLSCLDCPFQATDKFLECSNLVNSALSLIKELTEENERLKSVEFTCGFVKPHKVLECPIFDEIERAKADTVRKMQAEIEARCIKGGIYPAFVKSTIDKIAEEIINEKSD